MTKTRPLAAAAAVLTALAAVPSTGAPKPAVPPQTAAAPGVHLSAFGARGPAGTVSPKLDGALADLVRHVGRVRPGYELSDLRSLSPAARFTQSRAGEPARVLIDAVTRGDPQQLKSALTGLGLTQAAVYSNDVSGWLPVSALTAAAARAEVHTLRASMPHTRAGAVTSQGDFAQHSDVARSSNGIDGTGVTVGILSDSFNCYQTYASTGIQASGPAGYAPFGFTADAPTDVSTGDLPSVTVLSTENTDFCMMYQGQTPAQLPFSDEGRAMLQVVHDVAPGATLDFYTADNGEAAFATGIEALAKAGAKVIADDAGYFDEPFFQDDGIAQAINTVEGQGVAYFSAAGNDGENAYDNTSPKFVTVNGQQLLNFDTSGKTTTTSLPITIAPLQTGEPLALVVEWDQPYSSFAPGSPGASSVINVCVTGSGSDQIYNYDGDSGTCSGGNMVGGDPYQIIVIANPATNLTTTAAENLQVTITLVSGPVPGRIKFVLADDGAGSTINQFSDQGPTVQGHPGAAGAAAVGAAYYFQTPACGTTPAVLEVFSSKGGDPILFDNSGNRLSTPQLRQKPDFVGPDGVNNTFLGQPLDSKDLPNTSIAACQDMQASATIGVYPSFFGTSAATPHAAGIAALMLQARSNASPDDIYAALRSTALPMLKQTQVPDTLNGYGFIQADAALAALASSSGSGGSSSSSSSSSSSATASSPATGASGGSAGGGGALDWVTLVALGALGGLGARQRLKRAPRA